MEIRPFPHPNRLGVDFLLKIKTAARQKLFGFRCAAAGCFLCVLFVKENDLVLGSALEYRVNELEQSALLVVGYKLFFFSAKIYFLSVSAEVVDYVIFKFLNCNISIKADVCNRTSYRSDSF